MTTTRDRTVTGRTENDLPTTTIFELLANSRRRLALQYLRSRVGAVPLGDLADQIALWEGEHTQAQSERISICLVHLHLPKLADAGIVRYDPTQETVELEEAAAQLTPFLDLATPTENLSGR